MADLSIQGEVVVNSEKAESAFDRVGDKASQMANEVATSANKAGQAVDKIGDGADKGAEKFTRAEARMRDSIKRSTQELQLLGKTASEKLEFNIQSKGLDSSKFSGYIAELKKVEEQSRRAQQVATGSLNSMGMSAKATAAALRGVPAQFTDIITSLQGGQAPLTVFLQQGGQLKDMFGGAGNAARALGGYVLGLVNPFTIAAAAVGGIAFAYNQGAKEADAYRAALVTTGNAAGTNAAQLKSYAQEISTVVGTQGKAAEALAALAATGKVSAENLREAAQAAVAYERATGQAASKTAEQFASLRNEPLSAVLKLNEGMNFLTDSTYKQIKSLEEQGRVSEAANVAQRAFADTLTSRAGEMERNLGTVERGWLRVKDAAKGAWDAILNVGRADTVGDRLSVARATLEQKLNTPLAVDNAAMRGSREKAIAALRQEISLLSEQERMTRRGAEAEAQRAEQMKAQVSFDKAGEKFLTDKVRMERELAAARVQGAAAGRTQAEVEKRLGEIRASYAKKGGSSVATENKDLRDQQRIFAELADVSSTYYSELAAAQEQRAKGNIGEAQYIAYVNDLIQKQPFAVALAKDEAAANVALSKAYAEAAAERIKTIQSMERAADGLQSQNDALREEIELIGLSTEQQTLVLQQRNDAIILTKEATLAELERQSAITGTQTRVEIALASEIEALKERNALLGAKGVKNAAVDAAKTAKDEWQKTTDSINQSLTDSLLRGFESGKDMARNLRDTVVSMFKTMVLRPVISAIINPISGALTGMMGLSGAAQAGQGAGGALSTIGSIGSGYSMLSSLGTFGGGLSAGFGGLMGSLGMSATGATFGGAMSAGSIALGAGNIAGGLGTLAGALGPIAIGIALLSSLIKKSTPHMGAASSYSEAGGLVSGADIYRASGLADVRTYNAGVEQVTGNVAKAIGDTLNATARAFGKTAGYEITTAFADDKSKDGAWGQLLIEQLGKTVLDWRDTQTSKWAPREFADGEAGSKEYLAAVAKSARDALVQAIGDVGWANDMLTALGESPTLEGLAETVQQINAAQAAFENLGKNIIGFGALTDGAISQLVKAAGGIEGLVSAASTYYENFYSEAEKTANVTRDVASALADVGLQMPATRQEFRALVEAQMSLGESGTKAVAALLGVAGAFASVTAAVRSEQTAERADRLAAQRAQEKAQAEALQKQIQAYADGAEQFNTLRDSLLKAGDAAGLLAAATERAFADPLGTAPKWGANSTAASFNYEYGMQQAAMRQGLSNELSANALRVANVGGALGGLSISGMMGQDDPVIRAVYIGMRDAMVQAAGDAGFAVRDAVDGAALYAAQAQVRAQFSATGPGLASVYAARESYGLASSNTDVKVYEDAQRKLNGALSSGAIGADQFARALQALNDTLPQAAALSGDFDAQAARAAAALDELAQTGLRSIGYYFGQLNTMALELAKMDEPINATIASIGRLNSFETAFGVSADAAGVTGLSSLQIDRAQLIAEAAGIASAAMTTADAAAAAAQLAQSPAFAELGAKGIRDAALLLDGVGEYNADGFERAFIRISDALATGSVTEGQYKALFDTALDMFNGVPEETRALIDSMTRLRDAMSGFADGLLIDEQRTTLSAGDTLAEMQRQYAQAFAGASTGDNEAIGKYQQLATTLLDKDLYSTRAEYNAAFGSVYGDARQLESIGINTLANAQGNEMVSELKDMNAKLNKRVEDLEKNLLAALAQIAKNTSDTSRGIEQQIVMAEETP